MTKVLHFSLTENIGGIESLLLRVSKGIENDRNIQFEFVTFNENKLKYESFFEKKGLKVHHLSSNQLKASRELKKLFMNNKYDYIHFHKNSLINILPILIANKNSTAKIIIHAHNTASTLKSKKLNFLHYLNRIIINNMHVKRIACSKNAAKWMFGNHNYKVIHNGIDLNKYSFDLSKRLKLREEYEFKNNDIILGTVGRMESQKNQKFLINLLKDLLKTSTSKRYKLVLVGSGSLRKELEYQVKKLQVSDNVYFVGARSDVQNMLLLMDVFLMPSIHEGLPIAGIEAIASGLPLIVSDNVTKELNITGNIKFLSIDSTKKWSNYILNHHFSRNLNTIIKLKNNHYDINDTVEKIKNLYLGE